MKREENTVSVERNHPELSSVFLHHTIALRRLGERLHEKNKKTKKTAEKRV